MMNGYGGPPCVARTSGGREARSRGGTRQVESACFVVFAGFNPRARVGRDRLNEQDKLAVIRFNPRARVGRDPLPRREYPGSAMFQSTRPRGARRGG